MEDINSVGTENCALGISDVLTIDFSIDKSCTEEGVDFKSANTNSNIVKEDVTVNNSARRETQNSQKDSSEVNKKTADPANSTIEFGLAGDSSVAMEDDIVPKEDIFDNDKTENHQMNLDEKSQLVSPTKASCEQSSRDVPKEISGDKQECRGLINDMAVEDISEEEDFDNFVIIDSVEGDADDMESLTSAGDKNSEQSSIKGPIRKYSQQDQECWRLKKMAKLLRNPANLRISNSDNDLQVGVSKDDTNWIEENTPTDDKKRKHPEISIVKRKHPKISIEKPVNKNDMDFSLSDEEPTDEATLDRAFVSEKIVKRPRLDNEKDENLSSSEEEVIDGSEKKLAFCKFAVNNKKTFSKNITVTLKDKHKAKISMTSWEKVNNQLVQKTFLHCPSYPRFATLDVDQVSARPSIIDQILASLDIEVATLQNFSGPQRKFLNTLNYKWYLTYNNDWKLSIAIVVRKKNVAFQTGISQINRISDHIMSAKISILCRGMPHLPYPDCETVDQTPLFEDVSKYAQEIVDKNLSRCCVLFGEPPPVTTDYKVINRSHRAANRSFTINLICVRLPKIIIDAIDHYGKLFDWIINLRNNHSLGDLLIMGDFNCCLSQSRQGDEESHLRLSEDGVAADDTDTFSVLLRLFITTLHLRVNSSFSESIDETILKQQRNHILTHSRSPCLMTSLAAYHPEGNSASVAIAASLVPLLGFQLRHLDDPASIGFQRLRKNMMGKMFALNQLKKADSNDFISSLWTEHCLAVKEIRDEFLPGDDEIYWLGLKDDDLGSDGNEYEQSNIGKITTVTDDLNETNASIAAVSESKSISLNKTARCNTGTEDNKESELSTAERLLADKSAIGKKKIVKVTLENLAEAEDAVQKNPVVYKHCPKFPRIANLDAKNLSQNINILDDMLASLDIEIATLQNFYASRSKQVIRHLKTKNYIWYLPEFKKVLPIAVLIRRSSQEHNTKRVETIVISDSILSVKVSITYLGMPHLPYPRADTSDKNRSFFDIVSSHAQQIVECDQWKTCTLFNPAMPGFLRRPCQLVSKNLARRQSRHQFLINIICINFSYSLQNMQREYERLLDFIVRERDGKHSSPFLIMGDFNCSLSASDLCDTERRLELIGSGLSAPSTDVFSALMRLFITTLNLRVASSFGNFDGALDDKSLLKLQRSHILMHSPSPFLLTSLGTYKFDETETRLANLAAPIMVASLVPLVDFTMPRLDDKARQGFKLLKKTFTESAQSVCESNEDDEILPALLKAHCEAVQEIRAKYLPDETDLICPFGKQTASKESPKKAEIATPIEKQTLTTEELDAQFARNWSFVQILMVNAFHHSDIYSQSAVKQKILEVWAMLYALLDTEALTRQELIVTFLNKFSLKQREFFNIYENNCSGIKSELKFNLSRKFDDEWRYALILLCEMQKSTCTTEGKSQRRNIVRSILRYHLDFEPLKVASKIASFTSVRYRQLSIGKWSTIGQLKNRLGEVSTEFDDVIMHQKKIGDETDMKGDIPSDLLDCNPSTSSLLFKQVHRALGVLQRRMCPQSRLCQILRENETRLQLLIEEVESPQPTSTKSIKEQLSAIVLEIEDIDVSILPTKIEDELKAILSRFNDLIRLKCLDWSSLVPISQINTHCETSASEGTNEKSSDDELPSKSVQDNGSIIHQSNAQNSLQDPTPPMGDQEEFTPIERLHNIVRQAHAQAQVLEKEKNEASSAAFHPIIIEISKLIPETLSLIGTVSDAKNVSVCLLKTMLRYLNPDTSAADSSVVRNSSSGANNVEGMTEASTEHPASEAQNGDHESQVIVPQSSVVVKQEVEDTHDMPSAPEAPFIRPTVEERSPLPTTFPDPCRPPERPFNDSVTPESSNHVLNEAWNECHSDNAEPSQGLSPVSSPESASLNDVDIKQEPMSDDDIPPPPEPPLIRQTDSAELICEEASALRLQPFVSRPLLRTSADIVPRSDMFTGQMMPQIRLPGDQTQREKMKFGPIAKHPVRYRSDPKYSKSSEPDMDGNC